MTTTQTTTRTVLSALAAASTITTIAREQGHPSDYHVTVSVREHGADGWNTSIATPEELADFELSDRIVESCRLVDSDGRPGEILRTPDDVESELADWIDGIRNANEEETSEPELVTLADFTSNTSGGYVLTVTTPFNGTREIALVATPFVTHEHGFPCRGYHGEGDPYPECLGTVENGKWTSDGQCEHYDDRGNSIVKLVATWNPERWEQLVQENDA